MLKGDKKYQVDLNLFEKIKKALEDGKFANTVEMNDDELNIMKSIQLLTNKPVIYACNVSDTDFSGGQNNNPYVSLVEEKAKNENAEVLTICAQIEQEISELDEEEKTMFLSDLGFESSGLDRMIAKCYSLLYLISYITTGEMETKAWTITKGTKAPQAAGKIHSDFERGFIRAEIVSYNDLIDCGTMVAAKEKGLVRSEGKEYVVQDGDIVLFRFNV